MGGVHKTSYHILIFTILRQQHHGACHYSEFQHIYLMLSVIMLNVFMLNVFMLNVFMLNVIILSFIILSVVLLSVITLSFN
jgi:hypothetical protein